MLTDKEISAIAKRNHNQNHDDDGAVFTTQADIESAITAALALAFAWRPIEKAPKGEPSDILGPQILTTDGETVAIDHWAYCGAPEFYQGWVALPEPTHWMPLPPAPGK